MTASNRRPSAPYSRNTPQSFSRGTPSYAFSRSTKHVTVFVILPGFLENLLGSGKLFCSAKAATKTPPNVIQLWFIYFRGIMADTLPGRLAKRCRSSWLVHSCLPFLCGDDQFANLSAPFQNAMPLDTHESAKPPSVPSSPNSLSNVSQLAKTFRN